MAPSARSQGRTRDPRPSLGQVRPPARVAVQDPAELRARLVGDGAIVPVDELPRIRQLAEHGPRTNAGANEHRRGALGGGHAARAGRRRTETRWPVSSGRTAGPSAGSSGPSTALDENPAARGKRAGSPAAMMADSPEWRPAKSRCRASRLRPTYPEKRASSARRSASISPRQGHPALSKARGESCRAATWPRGRNDPGRGRGRSTAGRRKALRQVGPRARARRRRLGGARSSRAAPRPRRLGSLRRARRRGSNPRSRAGARSPQGSRPLPLLARGLHPLRRSPSLPMREPVRSRSRSR